MANERLTDQPELTVQADNADVLHIVDLSDGPNGTSKKITVSNLMLSAPGGGGSSTILARNNTGSTIVKGKAVYISGVVSSTPTIGLADNSSASTMNAVGLVQSDIANNTDGNVLISGELSSIDTSAFSASDTIYVGTSGDLTATKPTGTALIQNLGTVLKVSASTGSVLVQGAGRSNDVPNLPNKEVFIGDATGTTEIRKMEATDLSDVRVVSPANRQHLIYDSGVSQFGNLYPLIEDASNVDGTTPSNGDVLTYDTGTSLWRPQAPSGGSNTFVETFAFFDNIVRDVFIPFANETESTTMQRYNRFVCPVDLTVLSVTIYFGNAMTGGTGTVDLGLNTGGSIFTSKTTATIPAIAAPGTILTFTFSSNNTFTQNQVMCIQMLNGFTGPYGNITGTVYFSA